MKWRISVLVLALALLAAACSDSSDDTQSVEEGEAGGGNTLQEVKDRGELKCGVNDQVPGFGFVDEQGNRSGFDIEYCRAVAAAVLGDSDKVEFRTLTAEDRFTALQSKEIDVLIRNTTNTATRDGSEASTFATTTFYDGQGMMVKTDSGITDVKGLDGQTICVLRGTTTELNLATIAAENGITLEPLAQEENDVLQESFIQGRCQGWTSDKSQLAGVRSNWPESDGGPTAVTILDETFSKEPLGPVTRDGDDQWSEAVNWTVIATINSEELGITKANVEEMKSSDNPDVQRLLGVGEEGEPFDPGLGLDTDFVVNVISSVGNYGEIYNANVGPDTPLGLERGQNNLFTNGGLLYGPPYR